MSLNVTTIPSGVCDSNYPLSLSSDTQNRHIVGITQSEDSDSTPNYDIVMVQSHYYVNIKSLAENRWLKIAG